MQALLSDAVVNRCSKGEAILDEIIGTNAKYLALLVNAH